MYEPKYYPTSLNLYIRTYHNNMSNENKFPLKVKPGKNVVCVCLVPSGTVPLRLTLVWCQNKLLSQNNNKTKLLFSCCFAKVVYFDTKATKNKHSFAKKRKLTTCIAATNN